MKYYLRDIKISDLENYYYLNDGYKKFKDFNGPYFKLESSDDLKNRINEYSIRLNSGDLEVMDGKRLIIDSSTENIIGEVNYYWKSIETNWLECGIVIFEEKNWGKGIGKVVLPLWINYLFNKFPDLVRIGITTWSGNLGMINLAHSIGLNLEACYKKARIVDGEYYDSVSYGILKEDWLKK